MADKYVELNGGRLQEKAAVDSSAGVGDAGKIPALDSTGRLNQNMMPVGFVDDVASLVASETLAAGDLVSVWNDAGTPKVRKADATTSGKEVDGFVMEAVTLGNPGNVYFEGINNQLAALTPGSRYYLSTTAGGITATPPSGAGNVVQYVGRAISATELSFEPDQGVIVA